MWAQAGREQWGALGACRAHGPPEWVSSSSKEPREVLVCVTGADGVETVGLVKGTLLQPWGDWIWGRWWAKGVQRGGP